MKPYGYLPITAQLGGLDLKRTYKVEVVTDLAPADFMQRTAPGWYPTITATGAELSLIGLEIPGLRPESPAAAHPRSLPQREHRPGHLPRDG